MIDEIEQELHKITKNINIVYGINTDVGKTHITISVIKKLLSNCKKIFAIKPIISGFHTNDYKNSDGYKLLQACGLENPTLEETLKLYAFHFKEPLSPDIASWKEGVEIDFEQIINFCRKNIDTLPKDGKLFIETAGGVCSPCSNFYTMADISKNLADSNLCNILVTTPYLGSLSHTISALHILQFDVIIINKYDEDFYKSLKNHLPYKVKILWF